jgi:signal transduction histidine kinase
LNANGDVTGVRTAAVDVTVRARVELELRRRDQQQSQFFNALAHEIRNVSHAANLGLLLARAHPTALDSAFERAQRQLGQLERLARDLLDAARLSHIGFKLAKQLVDVRHLVSKAISDHESEIARARLRLETEFADTPVTISADPERLFQVLQNLIGNAVRHTPAGGTITVAVNVDSTHIRIDVADTGDGIPADKLQGIFDAFALFGPSSSSRDGGMGIGLSVARELVRLHGGSIEASSPGLNCGSRFRVLLPS